ncbi:MAG: exodeoxyribonuclease VII small subunit [Burkholderiales bacterium]|nr:exodeoxyribonuclease VII small subunit [Burkholderiales bacterium]
MTKPENSPENFEAALAELESIVAKMEAGQLSLEDSLAAYRRGSTLLQYCQTKLKDAEQQIEILESGTLKNWTPDVE